MVSSTPRPHFTPGKDPVPILQEAGWAPGPVCTGGKSRPHRDSIPDRPARSSVAIPTELPGTGQEGRLKRHQCATSTILQNGRHSGLFIATSYRYMIMQPVVCVRCVTFTKRWSPELYWCQDRVNESLTAGPSSTWDIILAPKRPS